MTDTVFREYEPGDRAGVLALLGKVFPDAVSEEAFRWRFEENPLGAPVRVVAVHDGTVVGFNSWMPWPIELDGKPVRAVQSGESAVDPAMQGRGIFGKLIRLGAEVARAGGADLFTGFPNRNSRGSLERAGWLLVSTLEWWVRPTPLSFFGISPRVKTASSWRRLAGPSFRTRFDAAFLDWRFTRNPYYRYDVARAGDASVFSRVRRRGPVRERMAVLGLGGGGDLLDPADTMRIAASQSSLTAFVSLAVPPDVAARHDLRGRGYHRVPGRGGYFMTLPLSSIDPALVANAAAWAPTSADMDID